MRICGLAIAAILAVLAAGCTILTSETLDELAAAQRAPRGTLYFLPKGTVDVTLKVDPAKLGFLLDLKEGEIIPDTQQEYVLRYRQNPAYQDEISVTTDDKGLLKEVKTTTIDKTPGVIVNVARALSAFGGLESTQQATEWITLYTQSFDPTDDWERGLVVKSLNRQITTYIETASASCNYVGGTSSTAAQQLETLKSQQQDKEINRLKAQKQLIDAMVKPALDELGKQWATQPPEEPKTPNGANTTEGAEKTIECPAKGSQDTQENPTGAETDHKKKRDAILNHACKMMAEQRDLEKKISEKEKAELKITAAVADVEGRQKARAPICSGLEKLRDKPPVAKISILNQEPSWNANVVAASAGVAPDCTIGICYRPTSPVKVNYSIGGGDHTLLVDLPNREEIVSVDVRRAFSIKKVQTMNFDRGVLTKLHIDKESELLAVSKLPVEVLSAVADGLKIRVSVTTEEKNLLQREADLLKAEAALAAARSPSRERMESLSSKARPTTGAMSPPVLP
jgi:hypothetical protein